jgi:hypothetical protein
MFTKSVFPQQPQQNPESITITTYYPAPFGVYEELRSNRMAIGDNYSQDTYCWSPAACANQIDANADLVVEGRVGIATPNPGNMLDVVGDVRVQPNNLSNLLISNAPDEAGNFDNVGLDLVKPGGTAAGARILLSGFTSPANTGGRLVFYTSPVNSTINPANPQMTIAENGNVGIGTSIPQGILDISSTTSAFIPPRMTTAQRNNIQNPVNGMMIYNTNTNDFETYSTNNLGTSWGSINKPDYDSGWFTVAAGNSYTLRPNQNTYYSKITVFLSADAAHTCRGVTGFPYYGGATWVGCVVSHDINNIYIWTQPGGVGYTNCPALIQRFNGWYRVLAWR